MVDSGMLHMPAAQKYNYDRRICTNQGTLNLLKLKTFLSLMDDEREVSN
jgi:hypothetical protein